MLPLAWAVVEVENKFNWTWFLRLLKDDLELGDGTNFTFITDMHKELYQAMDEVLPNYEHRMCARHILANWSKKWRGIERRNYFWRCARSTYEAELEKNLDFMKKLGGKGIIDDLFWYSKERWSKVYFKFFSNYDSVDNNMAEIFNSWILEPRHKTIITMLDEIRVKMMNRIGQLREFANGWICDISPMALKVLQDNTTKSMKCDIMWNGDTGYEVKENEYLKHLVSLQTMTCSCRSWMLKGIPCAHAVAALHFKKLEPINYIAHCQKDVREAKEVRNKEQTENKISKLSRRGLEMTCRACKEKGHNKRGCHKTKAATSTAAASGATSASAGASAAPRGSSKSTAAPKTRGGGGRPKGSTNKTRPYKRSRVVGMEVLQTESGYTILNEAIRSSKINLELN
ncbi:uncharacterized protein [Nicotiana sylvestris]|uniref:Uncharacterized protein LOC104215809 isoform X2 n=1 Tax=Nicotiana sylvestris TaxID=4096 RepID=A0A1U7VQ52_NICSY|nr:PREDICTED: uncharacterized protein LOC104215809 isoform X2 [Nicotiana sylvestris]